MHRLARGFLVIALAEFVFCAAAVTFVWWPWPLVVFVAIWAMRRWERAQRIPLWKYGTARWANESELRRAGMIGGDQGLSVGRVNEACTEPWTASMGAVLDPRVPDREACERAIIRLCQVTLRKRPEIVRLAKSVHIAVFGPTGAGKGVSFLIPWLQESCEPAVVLDFKGELAALTALHRERKFGHRSVLLDPFRVVTKYPDCLNPLDSIVQGSSEWMDDCRDLAEQTVVRTGEEREKHWDDSAEMWIAGTTAATVLHAPPDNRSLQTVRDVLSNPAKIPQLIQLLCESDGLVGRWGGQLAHFQGKELSSVLTTANRHLRFLDTPAVAENTAESSFDPRELRNGKITVYCILPPEHMRAQAALIRLWIGTLLRTIVKGGLQHG